jgi:hypothetical protein
MIKSVFVFAFAVLLAGATIWLVYDRTRSDGVASVASMFPVQTDSPTPTPSVGDVALQDVKNILRASNSPEPQETQYPVQTLEAGMKLQDIKIGTGQEAQAGMAVAVHYTGRLADGSVFDSSIERKQPFEFILGSGMVIRGWDLGVVGMRVGGKRSLLIPPSLAYGQQGAGGGAIPPNAILLFDVELLAVQSVKNSQ